MKNLVDIITKENTEKIRLPHSFVIGTGRILRFLSQLKFKVVIKSASRFEKTRWLSKKRGDIPSHFTPMFFSCETKPSIRAAMPFGMR